MSSLTASKTVSPAAPTSRARAAAALLESMTQALPLSVERLLVLDASHSPPLLARIHPRGGGDERLPWASLDAPLPAGASGVDAAVVVGALERAARPELLLADLACAIAPGGALFLAVPNLQHHAALSAVLRGDFPATLCDGRVPLRPFTFAAVEKLLLDAGFVGGVTATATAAAPPPLAGALQPALDHLRADAQRSRLYLDAAHLVFGARRHGAGGGPADVSRQEPMTFVACVNDEAQLADNLLASPCLLPGTPHQVILVRDASSAAEGLERGRAQALHDPVVCLHQDMYLPAGWPDRVRAQLREAERRFGPIGVAGLWGIQRDPRDPAQSLARGHVIDRHRVLEAGRERPDLVHTLDEIVLVFPRRSPLHLDPDLGWHLYGNDVAWRAQKHGCAAVALDAPCLHNSLGGFQVPEDFHRSATVFREKWRDELPIQTSCAIIGPVPPAAEAAPTPAR